MSDTNTSKPHITLDLLALAREHVDQVTNSISAKKDFVDTQITYLRKRIIHARGDDRDQFEGRLLHELENQRMMETQIQSPYFVRCDVHLDGEQQAKIWYFGKFPFLSESIYSWVTPAATIRFESPGRFRYTTPEGEDITGALLRKDQFLIVNKKILFMATENKEQQRKLVYQEYFSQKKDSFALTEIVEQMEKAQDTIIRAHHRGSFLISGPAGSGKTTLALHRVAFLVQSPDTSALFPEKEIIIFVQDRVTQEYFAKLLPSLGIYDVSITTFDQWAMSILGLTNVSYAMRSSTSLGELELDAYEFAKYQSMKEIKSYPTNLLRVFDYLEQCYEKEFTTEQKELFKKQKKALILDRFDLTLLLKATLKTKDKLTIQKEKFTRTASGKYTKKLTDKDVSFALMVIDEAENYLPEQLQIFKSCSNKQTQAIIYVGDLVQQTLPFTIKQWADIEEKFDDERKVVLQKVYRNTKQILEYIKSHEYEVVIPEEARGGEMVEEIAESKVKELIINKHIKDTSIGILAQSEQSLGKYRRLLDSYKNVHCFTINEAQGVEFDTVFLVSPHKPEDNTHHTQNNELIKEREKVNRDLLYVAYTRAIQKLYIVKAIS